MEGVLGSQGREDRVPDVSHTLGFSESLDEMLLQHGEFPAAPLLTSSFRYCIHVPMQQVVRTCYCVCSDAERVILNTGMRVLCWTRPST